MWPPVKRKPASAAAEAQEAPVTQIVAAMINQAILEKAGSIQLVPSEAGMRVEYLVEGVWRESMSIPKHLEAPLTEHIKEMAGLPLGYRMAMEGLIIIRHASGLAPGERVIDVDYAAPTSTTAPRPSEQDYDVHLSIAPTRQGEKITLRMEAVSSLPD